MNESNILKTSYKSGRKWISKSCESNTMTKKSVFRRVPSAKKMSRC